MKTMLALLPVAMLAGCATGGGYDQYLVANANALKAAYAAQKPLIRITAIEGQPITGLASLEVYGPINMPNIQQKAPNEWASVVQSGLSVIGAAGSLYLGGQAAVGLVNAVGTGVNQALSVQPPPTVVNQPAPTIVTQPAPVIVPPVDPIVVTQPNPIIVNQPQPIVLETPNPIIIQP